MAGYTSINGQWLGNYRKQACNKFLKNREHSLVSIKENTYPNLFNQNNTSYIYIYVENLKIDKIQEWWRYQIWNAY